MAEQDQKQEEEGALRCANHPATTTYIRCSRCEKPICTRCMYPTPVGYRCAECFNPQVTPMYKLDTSRLPLAIAAGLGVAVAGGIFWGFFPQFAFWDALLMGFVISDVIGRFANQKRGPVLQYSAVAAAVFGFVVALLVYSLRAGVGFDRLLSTATRYGLNGPNNIIDLFHLLLLGLVCFMCWVRLR